VEEGKPPPIWIAAMGPKMLKLAAEYGDGWIPTSLNPSGYGERLKEIQKHRKKLDKTNTFTAALWNWCIMDEEPSECERMMNAPLAKAFALLSPGVEWKRLGYNHPFGDNFNPLTNYIPMKYDRKTTLEAIEKVPQEVLQKFYMTGGTETMIKHLEDFTQQGLEHIIFWNVSGMMDLEKVRSSYKIMKEVIAYVKG
jgi:phthiodiolone/phenolphthiodiolone dimycocerosates ketoreductase